MSFPPENHREREKKKTCPGKDTRRLILPEEEGERNEKRWAAGPADQRPSRQSPATASRRYAISLAAPGRGGGIALSARYHNRSSSCRIGKTRAGTHQRPGSSLTYFFKADNDITTPLTDPRSDLSQCGHSIDRLGNGGTTMGRRPFGFETCIVLKEMGALVA
ncbi:hypothetical protein ACOMHN_019067 [Nucella lapillus]